jgi:transcription elongation factor Elf1
MDWLNLGVLPPREFKCGFCGREVASNQGHWTQRNEASTRICPRCTLPTLFYGDRQIPGVVPGNRVDAVPQGVAALYEEARNCVACNSFTSAVLTCRKLLMNIAVAQGAAEGASFLDYVNHLANAGFVPPNGRAWVDHIRRKGNEANHEIKLMTKDDALELISFSEMLLKFIYEFPAKIPGAQ